MAKTKPFILVAEDDRSYARIYKMKLTKEGFDVEIVGDGQQALQADPKLKTVPVVIFSNLGQDTDKEKALRLGATDYFVKSSVSVQEMVEKLKTYTY